MDMETITLIMGMNMRVNFIMAKKMVKELILGKTVMNTKEIGLMI
jgi:hypothetical protein